MRRLARPRVAPYDPCARVAGPLTTITSLLECLNACAPAALCEGGPQVPDDLGAAHIADPLADADNYTPAEIAWLTAADRAIARASEKWVRSTCSPYLGGLTCVKARRCFPCGCVTSCRCGGAVRIDVPVCGPIFDAAITIWGADPDVDPTVWALGTELRVDNEQTLVVQRKGETLISNRLGSQNLAAPAGDPCTWELEVCSGHPLDCCAETPDGRTIDPTPWFVVDAVTDMAAWFMLRCLPADRCTIADNVTRTVHDGIVMELDTSDDAASAGATGITSWDDAVDEFRCPSSAGIFLPVPDDEQWIVTPFDEYPVAGLGVVS